MSFAGQRQFKMPLQACDNFPSVGQLNRFYLPGNSNALSVMSVSQVKQLCKST